MCRTCVQTGEVSAIQNGIETVFCNAVIVLPHSWIGPEGPELGRCFDKIVMAHNAEGFYCASCQHATRSLQRALREELSLGCRYRVPAVSLGVLQINRHQLEEFVHLRVVTLYQAHWRAAPP
jgi:hypothetical protein